LGGWLLWGAGAGGWESGPRRALVIGGGGLGMAALCAWPPRWELGVGCVVGFGGSGLGGGRAGLWWLCGRGLRWFVAGGSGGWCFGAAAPAPPPLARRSTPPPIGAMPALGWAGCALGPLAAHRWLLGCARCPRWGCGAGCLVASLRAGALWWSLVPLGGWVRGARVGRCRRFGAAPALAGVGGRVWCALWCCVGWRYASRLPRWCCWPCGWRARRCGCADGPACLSADGRRWMGSRVVAAVACR
jgi:hypothetical protein